MAPFVKEKIRLRTVPILYIFRKGGANERSQEDAYGPRMDALYGEEVLRLGRGDVL